MDMVTAPESFPAYCRRERAALVRLAIRLTGSAADGEDLAQDVLERLSRRWPQLGALDSVDSYARRALINQSRTRHRRRQSEQALLGRLAAQAVPPSSAGNTADDGMWALVRALPGRQPAVVALVALEGRSHAEVAAILGISAANSRQTYSRACRRLRVWVRELA
ncbi:MAG: sigma-70 family RNA polymerase sigma factor [Acidimicrobiales bacterium]